MLTTRGNAEGLAATAEAAAQGADEVATLTGDLSEPGVAAELIEATRARFGRVDQIVSNAGKAQKSTFGEVTREDITGAIAINTLPFVELVTAALPDLRSSAWPRVVALSSFVTNDFGINGVIFPATSAAKGAVEALAKALAAQLAADRIPVNCVAPGYTRKVGGHAALSQAAWDAAAQATPMGRIADPEDVAGAIAFMLSREAAHVTGQILRVDGGLSLL
jgi:NAD(P)-dependent dehydrogenase (short-subunit alcohol dehydrogenase family)